MMEDYDPTGTVFAFMFKDDLTPEDIQVVRDIAKWPIIVHPAVFRRINEILDRAAAD